MSLDANAARELKFFEWPVYSKFGEAPTVQPQPELRSVSRLKYLYSFTMPQRYSFDDSGSPVDGAGLPVANKTAKIRTSRPLRHVKRKKPRKRMP